MLVTATEDELAADDTSVGFGPATLGRGVRPGATCCASRRRCGRGRFFPPTLPWAPPVPPALAPRVEVARRPQTVPALAQWGTPPPTSTTRTHNRPGTNAVGWPGRRARDPP